MTESFEHQVRSYKLWTWLYGQLQVNEMINQADIIEYCEKNNLGSKKSILGILNEFIDSRLIQEVEISTNSVGRPKKGYQKIKTDNIDLTLLNMADFPPIVKEFIKSESEREKIIPTEVIIKLVAWSYNYLVTMQYPNNDRPVKDLPEYLKQFTDPIDRFSVK